MQKKRLGMALLPAAALLFLWLAVYIGGTDRLEKYILDEQVYDGLVKERELCDGALLKSLAFEGETLFYDRMSHTFYYSVPEGDKEGYNPVVSLKGTGGDVRFALRGERITDKLIQSGLKIECMVYDDAHYEPYTLAVTTLPIMSIEAAGYMSDDDVEMEMTLFDNRADAGVRLWQSEGIIAYRGRTTRNYEKKGYKVKLSDHLSLLGMRLDDDWVLYAGYNDQEKVRNVFSCNLWKNSCAKNNAFGIDNGVEYRYVELIINGMYEGLYALGYRIDDKQMGVDPEADNGCVYKKVNFYSEYPVSFTDEGTVPDYEISSKLVSREWEREKWQQLYDFYDGFWKHRSDDEWLMSSIDVDNSIDMHLFLNLVQGVDNVDGPLTKNMYLTARRTGQGTLQYLYTPWDLDITWGNSWLHKAHNYTIPYDLSPEDPVIWESGCLYQLLQNGNQDVRRRYRERYWELRADAWSDQRILEMLDHFETQIFDSGAYARERERWVNGSYVEDEVRLSCFKQYVLDRLAAMDRDFEQFEQED